ncbi:MAG: hypothetical protein HQ582_26800 [Planctomycetes bacterium]|nr:hypothetical protein [Planctomycetota bacterium]
MGVGYYLANQTKKQRILYAHIDASKARELAGNPVSAAITTWYLLQNRGDLIAFMSDEDDDWPFPSGSIADLAGYQEMTGAIVEALIEAEILRDDGKLWVDEDEPDTVFIRDLKNIWIDDD